MKIIFATFLIVYTCFCAAAQSKPAEIRLKYSKYNAVVTKDETLYVFDLVADTLSVVQHNAQEVMMLGNNFLAYTNDEVYYHYAFNSIRDLKASTLVPRPDGRKYDQIMVSRFNESHEREQSIFYSDTRALRFSYPSLTTGAITTLSYSVVYHNPWFIRHSYFQSFIPVIRSKVVVKAHKDISIGHHLFNAETVIAKQYTKGKYNYYEWEMSDVSPYPYSGTRHFSNLHFSPHIAVFPREVKTSKGITRYYSTVDDLYHFYQRLISTMNNDASPEMATLVEELTQGLQPQEKAKAIFYWVQDNIKYIAFLDGYNGYVPASPSEVFAKRFGDCKGMSVLIHKMLELAHVPAWLAWVGTRTIPYTYEQCPLPAVDNHMVAACQIGDSVFILDGTMTHLDFGLYPYHIQGKEVMIGLDDRNHSIFTVPVSPAAISSVTDSVSISLTGNTFTGQGKRVHTGFNKMELAWAMDGVTEADYRKKLTSILEKGNNKFRIDSHQVDDLFQRDTPATISYSFTLNDYAVINHDKIFVNLNLNKSYHNMRVDTTGVFSPVSNDFHFTEKHITRLEIPEGYEVSFVPADDTLVHDDIQISFRYTQHPGYVTLEKEIVFAFLEFPAPKISEWNTIIDQLSRNYRSSVVISRSRLED